MSNGVHTWPANAVERSAANVRLWHFGYQHKADRIAKFHFYSQVDPGNANEDYYRHLVQGDVPEWPAGEVLGKAGPLVLKKLSEAELPQLAACGPEREKTI
jgi:hypothetical protein